MELKKQEKAQWFATCEGERNQRMHGLMERAVSVETEL